MKVKWTTLGMVVFFLLSVVMTFCFIWQYRIPKLRTGTPPQSVSLLGFVLSKRPLPVLRSLLSTNSRGGHVSSVPPACPAPTSRRSSEGSFSEGESVHL